MHDCGYCELLPVLESLRENEVLLCVLIETIPEATLLSISAIDGFAAQFKFNEFQCSVMWYPDRSRLYYSDLNNNASWCPSDPHWIKKFRSLFMWGCL